MPQIQIAPNIAIDLGQITELINNPIFIMAAVLIGLVLVIFICLLIIRHYLTRRGKISHAFKRKVIQVLLPKDFGDEKQGQQTPELKQVQEKIGVMESFFSTLAGLPPKTGFMAWLTGQADIFSLELVAYKGRICMYMAVPEHLQTYVEEQIQAQFPKCVIDELPDYNIFSPKSFVAGKMLIMGRETFFPLKTYKKFDSDPLNGITNALSKIDEKDGAAIQIVIRSAHKKWHSKGIRVAQEMQQGKKMETAIKDAKGGIMHEIFKGFKEFAQANKSKPEQPKEQYRISPMEEEVVKALEEKASKAGVDANIRIVVASDDQSKVKMYLDNLVNVFAQYNVYKYGNGFQAADRKLDRLVHDFIYRNFDEGRKMLFNTEELASLYHMPIPLITEAPNMQWLESKKAPAPLNMPREGILLGYNIYRGKETAVRIQRDMRRRHMYVIGQTGTGKSKFMLTQCMQDIANGDGVCYIDPLGDDLEEILKAIPKERAEDVILFDPSDLERPIGLNMLEFYTPEQKTFVVNEIMNIFDKLYDLKATGGPMFEQYFKNACYLLMEDPESGSTLMEVPRVLADDDFRAMKLEKCKLQIVKDFWEKEAQKAGGEASLANMVPYITSKLTPFIANDFMRPIISQQTSAFDFRQAMDSQKILLCKLTKGKIGDNNAYLLGMIFIGKMLMAALARGDMPEDQRKDFYLYIDEFQNFLTESMQTILSEARKYRLCLTLGHQFIGQIIKNNDTKFKDAIFGNVGSKVAFRIGVDDAEALAKEFSPVFSAYDFLNVPNRNCYVKLLIDGANPPGFNMRTVDYKKVPGVPPPNPELAEQIRQLSRLKYGKDRDIIEMEVEERIKAFS